MGVGQQLKHAWNAFTNKNVDGFTDVYSSFSSFTRPDRIRFSPGNERSIVASIYNRIAIDVASVDLRHVRVDSDGQYAETIQSGLHNCIQTEANIDQSARSFIQDLVMTMFELGDIAVVPVDTTMDPAITGGYDIKTLRIGRVVQWYPSKVRVRLYNDETGMEEDVVIPKEIVALIENPLYSVMNEPNSTLQRIIRKLNLLDVVDEASSSGKLDLIIKLPYTVKSTAKINQAAQRRKEIEMQLRGSKYGIAYIDGTEEITQLNRPAENNLLGQVTYLLGILYGQLGTTEAVMNGTADEATMLNYQNRTIEPILGAIAEEFKRKFLTKTARSQGQTVMYFRDPFKLVPMAQMAEMADKFTRNEILTGNEVRRYMGILPSTDPKADELRNSNMPRKDTEPHLADSDSNPIDQGA